MARASGTPGEQRSWPDCTARFRRSDRLGEFNDRV